MPLRADFGWKTTISLLDKQAISLVTQTDSVPQYLIDTSDEQAWAMDLARFICSTCRFAA